MSHILRSMIVAKNRVLILPEFICICCCCCCCGRRRQQYVLTARQATMLNKYIENMNATEDFDAAHVEVMCCLKRLMSTAIQRCLFHSKSNLLPLTFQRNGEVIFSFNVCWTNFLCYTLLETITHPNIRKGTSSPNVPFGGDVLVSWRVCLSTYTGQVHWRIPFAFPRFFPRHTDPSGPLGIDGSQQYEEMGIWWIQCVQEMFMEESWRWSDSLRDFV